MKKTASIYTARENNQCNWKYIKKCYDQQVKKSGKDLQTSGWCKSMPRFQQMSKNRTEFLSS